MQTVENISALRSQLSHWRQEGHRIAFVPTMGNLHAGHMRLIDEAKNHASKVVCSIFVNPTQFGPNEDFASYPRTLAADQQLLLRHAADLLFLPSIDTMYPLGSHTVISVGEISAQHCGASRPGHFSGVATILAKLFNLVQPDIACFGEKDFQQLAVIRQMVKDLNFPIEIIGVATVREADGLAMSSRNSYLSASERLIAPLLYQNLCLAREDIKNGFRDYRALEETCQNKLQHAGFSPDYFAICRANDLRPAEVNDKDLIILAAAKLGRPRLIDNLAIYLP